MKRCVSPASFAAVLVALTILAISPVASAGEPDPLQFNPDSLGAPASDVGVDDAGAYAGSVIRTSPSDSTGDIGVGPDNLNVYRLSDETFDSGYSQSNLTSDSYSQLVAVPTADSNGAEVFSVAGPNGKVFLFDRTHTTNEPRLQKEYADLRANDIAISADGKATAVAFNHLDQAQSGDLVVLTDTGGDSFDEERVNLDSEATAAAIAPQLPANPSNDEPDQKVAVGTRLNGVTFYDGTSVEGNITSFTRDTDTRVTDIHMSGDGRYAAVGTADQAGQGTGSLYFFGQNTDDQGQFTTSYNQFVHRFNDPRTTVTEVAITTDGRYLAAGTADGRVRFLENTAPDDPEIHSAIVLDTWQHPDGARIQDLDVSNDGLYFVAAAGGDMHGFTHGVGAPIWTVDDARGSVTDVAVSGDGNHFVAVSNDGGDGFTYGWKHQRGLDVTTTPADPETPPRETASVAVNVTNTGSNVDTFTFLLTDVPSGWQVTPGSVTEKILPGRSVNFTVNLTPPKRAPPGLYSTEITTSSEVEGDRIGRDFINVTVPRVDRVNITTKNKSIQVDAGAQRIVPFQVDNEGNQKAFVNVTDIRQSHSTGEAWDVEVQEYSRDDPIQIERGGTALLNLRVRPPGSALDGDYSRITVILDSGGNTDTLNVTARVNPQFDFEAHLTQDRLEMEPDEFREVEVIVRNLGNSLDIIRINTSVTPEDVEDHWEVTIPPGKGNLTLGRGETKSVLTRVEPDAEDPEPATIRYELDSRGPPAQELTLQVSQPPEEDEDLIPGPGVLAGVAAGLAAAGLRRRVRTGGPPGG